MDQSQIIFGPFFAMMLRTLAVRAFLFFRRIRFITGRTTGRAPSAAGTLVA